MHDQKCGHSDHKHESACQANHCEPCNYTCPLTGFNFCCNAKTLYAMVIMVLWVSAFQWFWHTHMMHDMYHATAALWRSEAEMKTMINWIWGANALTGIITAYIFAKGFQNAGCREGLRFGIIMTLFAFPAIMISYAVMPISKGLFHMWLEGAAIQFIVGGLLLGCLFRCCHQKRCH